MGPSWEGRRKFVSKLNLILFSFLLALLVVSLRILDLQVTIGSDIAREIKDRFDRIYPIRIPLYRGSIKDQIGREIALSVPTLSVYVHPDPELIKKKEDFIRGLASISGVSEKLLWKRIKEGKGKPLKILSGLDISLKEELKDLIKKTENSRYVGLQEEYVRIYPNRTIASNTVGFVGVDGTGLEGMEYLLNAHLGGGFATALMYLNGGLGKIYLHPLAGLLGKERDVLLTLDLSVQSIIERIRDEIVKKWRPKKVSILVMDLSNGYIVGLATYPYFDPNRFGDYSPEKRRNFAVTDVFEPGSIMKPFFVGMALEKGYVSTKTIVDTGKGRIKVFDRHVRDIKRLGRIRLKDVLVQSSNVGTIKVASHLRKEDVEELLKRFHLDRKFGVFPGEANPQIPDFNYPANLLYSAIGQGIAFNTLNIAVAFGGLATGKILKPHIVKEIVSAEGKVVYRAEREIIGEKTFSDRTLRWIRGALTEVVERGTGKRAKSKYFTIAGKTGTSQKFDFKTGKYSKDKVVTYFAGFFPASDPRFVAVIVVDEPRGKYLYGGVVSAPYFKKLAEQIAFYYGLKPDKVK